MEIIDIVNRILRDGLLYIFTYMVFIKLINFKSNNKKVFLIAIFSLVETILGVYIAHKLGGIFAIFITYLCHSIVIGKMTNNKLYYSVLVTFISLTIAYLFYIISILISSFILKIIIPSIQIDNIAILLGGFITEGVLLEKFFGIKRLRNGIGFLKDKEKINNIGVIGIVFVGFATMMYSLYDLSRGRDFRTYLTVGILIEALCITIWIRRKITKHYKQNLKKNTIQELENKLKSKDEEINKILEENKEIATINHKYSSRIKALEKISTKILTKPEIVDKMKTEFGEEFGELQDLINKISEEYSKEIENNIKHKNELVKTGIFGIDNILEYMNGEAEKKNIKLDLKINGSINYMIEKIIDPSKLETLLGDHIKDAIIAIESSNNTYRRILVLIGIVEDCYEIKIYDTGIEFEIETLLKLGTQAITTHKETGGSGIGFMTTFETLKETKASLVIEEEHPMNDTDYTKAVIIRFDGKNEYRINSYRAKEIERQATDNRIIIKKLKK